jgi:hypothetical protein
MTKEQIQNFIAELPLENNDKSTLQSDLENNLPVKVIMEKVGDMISKKEKALHDANPDGAKAYAEINKEYEADVEKAGAEFDTTMAEIEKEADEVNTEVSKQIDQVRVEELKESLPQ